MDRPASGSVFLAYLDPVAPDRSTKAFLKDLSKMETVDREGDGLWNEAGTSEHCPEQKPPIMEPLFPDDPEEEDRPEKRGQIVGPESKGHLFFFLGYIFPQECPDPFIIVPWRIQGAEDLLIAVDQQVIVHPWDKIC